MSARRKYRVVIGWTHRKWGPNQTRTTAEGTSIRRALSNALLAFFSEAKGGQERRDAHTHIRVEAWRVKDTADK